MVKISIVSGFLGAGKTTLIKHLLQAHYFGDRPLLIENDYGSLGIDGMMLRETGVAVRELTNGCICCSLVGSFVLSLQQIMEEEHPEHIIIEPSGVGKLSEILRNLKELAVPWEKHLVVTVVDAKRYDHNDRFVTEYFRDQIAGADAVLLSKTAALSGKRLSALCTTIGEIREGLEVICVPWEAETLVPVFDALLSRKHPLQDAEDADVMQPGGAVKKIPVGTGIVPGRISIGGAVTGIDFTWDETGRIGVFESWSLQTDTVYTAKRLSEILNAFDQSGDCGAVIRAKGILRTPEGMVLLDYVPEEGSVTPAPDGSDGRVFVIGMHLRPQALEALFRKPRNTAE